MTHRLVASLCALAFAPVFEAAAAATPISRSHPYVTTGNGHGFAVFDSNRAQMTTFLEHPYRYLRPNPTDPTREGVRRRNLLSDLAFGARAGGSSAWLDDPAKTTDVGYLDESNIIHASTTIGAVSADTYFFEPFGLEGNVLVALLKAPGASDGFFELNFHMGTGDDNPAANGEQLKSLASPSVLAETGPGGGAMVYVPLTPVTHVDCQGVLDKVGSGADLGDNATCAADNVIPGYQAKLGADGWMAIAMAYVDDPADAGSAAAQVTAWANGRAPATILNDVQAEFESWRKPPPSGLMFCSDDERRVWRQSEAVLRMGQVREPNSDTRKSNGMILASLPPGEWHTGWVRDATYAIAALSRMGHFDEAKAALDFFLNAEPTSKFSQYVNGQSYRISVVRYFGSGEEESDYNAQGPNVEIDGWGLVLWAARQYVTASGDLAWLNGPTRHGNSNYAELLSKVATPLSNNLEVNGIARADSSIWEVHEENNRHFAFTTLAMVRGFCDFAALATRAGQPADAQKFAQLSATGRKAFLSAYINPDGALAGTTEGVSSYQDASVSEVFTWNLLTDYPGTTAQKTFELLDKLRVDSGGFKRNNSGQSSYDDNEWILVDLRISDAMRRAGRIHDADGYLQPIVDKAAANFNLLPELYNAVAADQLGLYTGSIPMVGYGGGTYVLTLLDRAGLGEPNDCGDGMSVTLTASQCTGAPNMVVAATGGPGGTMTTAVANAHIPYVGACLCSTGGRPPSRGTLILIFVPWLAALATATLRLPRSARARVTIAERPISRSESLGPSAEGGGAERSEKTKARREASECIRKYSSEPSATAAAAIGPDHRL